MKQRQRSVRKGLLYILIFCLYLKTTKESSLKVSKSRSILRDGDLT